MNIKLLKKGDFKRISDCFLFRNVEESFIRRAVSDNECKLISFGKKDVVFDIKDYQRSIGLLLSGSIEVSKSVSSNHRYIMNTLTAGSLFGAAAVFSDEPDYVTILTAGETSRILFFSQILLEALMRENFTITENYIRFLAGRINFLNRKIKGLISVSTEQAVANFLIGSMAEQDGKLFVTPAGSMSSLAKMLNIGRASLYRSFEDMEETGLIKRDGKKIEILDLNGLAGL